MRTAAEEEEKRSRAADDAPVPNNDVSKSMHRLIRSAFAPCRCTRHLNVKSVNAGLLGLDVFCTETERLIKAYNKWLDRAKILQEPGLHVVARWEDAVKFTVGEVFAGLTH